MRAYAPEMEGLPPISPLSAPDAQPLEGSGARRSTSAATLSCIDSLERALIHPTRSAHRGPYRQAASG